MFGLTNLVSWTLHDFFFLSLFGSLCHDSLHCIILFHSIACREEVSLQPSSIFALTVPYLTGSVSLCVLMEDDLQSLVLMQVKSCRQRSIKGRVLTIYTCLMKLPHIRCAYVWAHTLFSCVCVARTCCNVYMFAHCFWLAFMRAYGKALKSRLASSQLHTRAQQHTSVLG